MPADKKFEREPTDEELAELLDMTIDEVRTTVRSQTKQVSIDKPFSEDEGSSLLDVMEDEDSNEVDNIVYKDSLKREVGRLLSTLTERERVVINQYFGLSEEPSLSLEDIGENLGLTRERKTLLPFHRGGNYANWFYFDPSQRHGRRLS